MDLREIKALLESSPVALATTMADGRPNIIGVAFVRVVGEAEIVVTDNYMSQTVKDILANNNVCLLVWNSDLKGYKIVGEAVYHTHGPWLTYVKEMPENKGLPAKGAILITVQKIIPSI